MFIILLGIGVLSFTIYSCVRGAQSNKRLKQWKEEYKKKEGILIEEKLIHIAGFPYCNANDEVLLQIKNNNIIISKDFRPLGKGIDISQLTNYTVQTEEQLQKNVTIPRVLLVGIFALAIPKTTKINNQYLYLQYIENGTTIDCLFKNTTNNQPLGNIVSTINRLKIENQRQLNILKHTNESAN